MAWNWQRAVRRWGMWESMRPDGFAGQEKVAYAYCRTPLDVEVIRCYGSNAYQCFQSSIKFAVDWSDGIMRQT